ncbi:MAG: TadE/TadG family type IV pilus assembly protein, partial [Acidimicrobiia bacterium]
MRQGERGASLVEFAVVLPLLILLVFGIMEAGWLFAQQVEIRNA